MSTAPEYAPEAGDTLEQLVNQFTNQYAFLRELIQNSIDAGTKRADVWFEYETFEGGQMGALKLHVDDTGEGMNREIIDTQLTRLFSSSKENDLTKIGKFGIGFVSVFALKPEAVVLDTSRDGENWRIFFHGTDKHFDRIVLDHPVDGTEIQLIKMVSLEDYDKIRALSRETIVYWCKHCDVDIYVENQRINEPFHLPVPYVMTHQIPGTEVVLAPSDSERPFYGFYNRGLTLVESLDRGDPKDREDFPPGVQFKIKSRYLEHTLTRDNVLKDQNYQKAMAILRQVVDGPFRESLFKAAEKGGDDSLFGSLVPRLAGLPEELFNRPILPTVQGGKISLKQLKTLVDKQAEVFYDERETPISQALKAQGKPVLLWSGSESEPGLGKLLAYYARNKKGELRLFRASATYAQPHILTGLPRQQLELLEAAGRILKKAGSPYRGIFPGSFRYEGSCIQDRTYVLQEKPGGLTRTDTQKKSLWSSLFGGQTAKDLVVNVDDPLVSMNFRLSQKYPALAPYLLAWCVTVQDGLDPVTVTRMVEAALSERGELPKAGSK